MAAAGKLGASGTAMSKYGVIIFRNGWHHSYPQNNRPLGPEYVRSHLNAKRNQKVKINQDGEEG